MIGFGGFASVHAAHWKNTTSKFAIKKMTKSFTEKEIINEVCFNKFDYLGKLQLVEFIIFFSRLI
jgi:serine/threonine protein kinase